MRRLVLVQWGIVALALLPRTAASAADPVPNVSFQEWQVIDVHRGTLVAVDEWLSRLAQQDVIYVGEEHRNQWHVEAALKILRHLLGRDATPALAMEMFGWDGQAGLDQYIAKPSTGRDEFLAAARWQQNWGGPLEDYEPLVQFAREHGLSVHALNPPRLLVRKVAVEGLKAALADPEMARWDLPEGELVEDPAYREIILHQLRLCHGGLTDDGYARMYEASLFRDEGMATVISRYVTARRQGESQRAGPLVAYTGSGHIQYHLPVPKRVLRRHPDVQQVTVYLSSFAPDQSDEVTALIRDEIADYVWLTPVGAQGLPKRCR